MRVGCVKEIKKYEYRVGLTPDNVKSYRAAGHTVFIEEGAGEGSGFSDEEYVQAGAMMVKSAEEVWEKSEMIVKVKEPLPEEYPYFHQDLILYTYLHLAADRPQMEALMEAKVKGVAYETLMEKDGSLPLLASDIVRADEIRAHESDRRTSERPGRSQVSGKNFWRIWGSPGGSAGNAES